ncbi:hypothetical protein CsSME_00016459 [Camellia sinensis var. sinensis]
MVGFPKGIEFAVGGRRVALISVVNCEGEDEVEFNVGVYGDVGQLDGVRLGTSVLLDRDGNLKPARR